MQLKLNLEGKKRQKQKETTKEDSNLMRPQFQVYMEPGP